MNETQKAAKKLEKLMRQHADLFAATHLISDSVNERIMTVTLLETIPQFLRKQVPEDYTATTILSTVMIYTLPTASHAKEAILTQLESPLKVSRTLQAFGGGAKGVDQDIYLGEEPRSSDGTSPTFKSGT